jgi:hypothetical protein
MTDDTLKDIPGFEGLYAVTPDGMVWSYSKSHITKTGKRRWVHSGKWMSPVFRDGYWCINFTVRNVDRPFRINRLVAMTYIPNPDNKPEVNHKDGNKLNNNVDNLEWVTISENRIHAYKNKLINPSKGEKHHASKLTEDIVRAIRARYIPRKITHEMLGREYGVNGSVISEVINRKAWAHVI